ncbi:MAG TPA: response regulator transcription factor [Xanthomonadales bacterium]|nr:response regulator transcription factor [Xanthomonadales bacterium]
MAAVRIILVDDHAVVREGVRALLEEEPGLSVVGEFSDGAQALAAAGALAPDVAIVDLRMPGLSAVETITGLRRVVPDANILVFTSFGEDAAIRATLDAGAIGYLLKDALRGELVRAVRAVANGEPYLDPAAQRQLVSMLKRQPKTEEPLTARELSVLKLIAEGLANKQIARKLSLTEGTVKGYVSQILDKLHVADRTQAALHAVRKGLVDAEG